jgi:lysophospholipase L1-like esterase
MCQTLARLLCVDRGLTRGGDDVRGLFRTAALLVALVVPGALLAVPAAAPASTPAVAAAAPGVAARAGIDYVALGDSYSAGPLIPLQRVDPAGCLRSFNNYPAYLATYLQVATYRDVTCSGARVRDLFAPQTTIVPGPSPKPQVEALSAETDLVTIGIGGNDYGLFGSLIDTCEQVRAQDPQGAPCKAQFTNARGVDTKARDARRIQKHVTKAVKRVERAAPNAAVYAVGYPRLLPESGTCAAVPFATGDYAWGRRIEKLLNRSIRRAAKSQGAGYISLYPASLGHDACAGSQAWINGSELDPTRAANFHPFKVGMHQIGRAVYTRITGLPAPDDGDADAAPPLGSLVLNLL